MTRQQLKIEFNRLSNDNNFPTAPDKRQRGREFEQLICNLLENEGLQPNTNFRPQGEEIDGSFIWGHSVFLIEAKWHKSEMPASSIYQFKGKVDGKLVGTIGIYISISGFSSEAVDALTFGKSINIILFDKEDFTTCINEDNGFTKVLLKKLRVATERGTVFFQVKSVTISTKVTRGISKVSVTETNTSNFLTKDYKNVIDQLVFIVEGVSDQKIITAFAEKIFSHTNKRKEINIIVAGGKFSVAKLANNIYGNLSEKSKLVLVADSDSNKEETLNLLTYNLDNKNITTIIPDPEIEVWFGELQIKNRREIRNMAAHNKMETVTYLTSLIDKINIEKLRINDSSFNKFFEIITE
jgi:hypothetical protein